MYLHLITVIETVVKNELCFYITVHSSSQVPGHLHEGGGGTQDQPPRVQSPGMELYSTVVNIQYTASGSDCRAYSLRLF